MREGEGGWVPKFSWGLQGALRALPDLIFLLHLQRDFQARPSK